TAWMQIGLSMIAVLVGAFFIAASMTGTRLDPLEKSLAFAFTGLPSFLLLFLLSVQFSISFWTKNHRKKLIPDIDVLRQRLFGLSEGIRIRMETSEVVGFAVGLNSAVVYARKGRKKRMIVVGDQFLRNATDE